MLYLATAISNPQPNKFGPVIIAPTRFACTRSLSPYQCPLTSYSPPLSPPPNPRVSIPPTSQTAPNALYFTNLLFLPYANLTMFNRRETPNARYPLTHCFLRSPLFSPPLTASLTAQLCIPVQKCEFAVQISYQTNKNHHHHLVIFLTRYRT